MKALILFLFVATILVACKNEDCCSDSTVNEEWLDKTIAELEKSNLKQYFYIVTAEYKGECVVYVNNCCPMCSTAIILYRCSDGVKIDDPDLTKIKNPEKVWVPDNFSCQG